LVAVEAKPLAVQIRRSIDTVGVMSTGFEALDIDVPEKESLVGVRLKLDDLDRLGIVMFVEEKQFDGGGIPGEDREIHSVLIDGGAERVGPAGLRLERSQR